MKSRLFSFLIAASLAGQMHSATINWSAGVDNGFSLANGSSAPIGSLIRVGWFRDSGTGIQLTDSQIQALAATPAILDTHFVEVAATTIGSGFTPAIASHFSANSAANTGNGGLAVAGRQMYLWALNGSLATATQQSILYWDATDLSTNPDSSPQPPGVRWVFPGEEPVPGVTTIDLTDLTTGSSTLAAGAKILVGTFPQGTSATTAAPNFGMAAIDAPLAIVTTASLPGGVVGSSYNTSLVASGGRAPLEWTVTGGGLPGGVSLATNGTLSGTPTTAASFSFTATVTDDVGEDESRVFTVVVASTNVSITSASSLPSGIEGGNYSQTLAATGGTAPYTFSVASGTLPGTVTLGANGALTGVLGAPATYNFTATVTDSGGLSSNSAFSIVVTASPAITSPTNLPQGVVGSAYSFGFSILGGGVGYNWSLSAGMLPSDISLAPNGQLSGSPTVAGPSSFTIQATGPTGNVSTKSFNLVVNASLVSPTIDEPNFPVTAVSSMFNHTITASPSPSGYSASGLPKGLKLNTTTGAITGRATVSGLFMVKLKAKNGRGFGPELIAPLVVQALPTGAVGTFVGMVERSTVNSNLGGRLDLTTSATGAFTLKMTLGTTTTSVKGVLDSQAGQDPTLTATLAGAQIALTFDSDASTVDGTASIGMDSADVSGWRNVWNKLANPASALAGYYSFGMDLTTDIGSATVPQGTGFASFTVAADGKLTVKGKAADGSAVTTAGFVGSGGQVLVYQQLYAKQGTLLGTLTMTADPDGNFTENDIEGEVTWSKPATTGKLYPAQFGPLVLDAEGKYLAFAAKGSTVLGLPVINTAAELDFSEGGLAAASLNPDVPSLTLTSTFAAVIPANATKTTLKVVSATGAISGTFTLQDGVLKRLVPFSGIVIRKSSGNTQAGGYFLLNQLGLPASTLSGKVELSQDP